jgi:hypothetical protein
MAEDRGGEGGGVEEVEMEMVEGQVMGEVGRRCAVRVDREKRKNRNFGVHNRVIPGPPFTKNEKLHTRTPRKGNR